jgi:alkylation response protein AidB-like acyl-CoA dehydrogenase
MTDSAVKDRTEQAEFRQYCCDWLKDNLPPPSPVRLPQSALEIMTTDQLSYLKTWQLAAYKAGLVGCDYPVEYGGGGRTDSQRIANEEMQRVATPYMPNIIGLGMAAPTIYHHAQESVKAQLLPKLFSGEHIWCQGFSEPGAGSDLAGAQTFAEKKGDKWIINGHKVWTSLAHFAQWMILLARTDKSQKHGGLTYFVVPIESKLGDGVTVKPLIKMTGETGFNEVFFDDLEVDDCYRLDELGNGWAVAMTTLLHERGAGPLVTPQSGGQRQDDPEENARTPNALINLAKESKRYGQRAANDPVLRDKIMQLIIRQQGLVQNQRRANVAALTDHPMRLALQNKLVFTELMQETADTALEIQGASASLYMADDNAVDGGKWPLGFMNTFGVTIAAGTSEIQRNILGERVLGMPKSK